MVELKKLQIQYLKTTSGKTTAVVIKKYSRLKNGFKSAYGEIKNIKKGTAKKVTLSEFLNEY